jgi:hypothetical protein
MPERGCWGSTVQLALRMRAKSELRYSALAYFSAIGSLRVVLEGMLWTIARTLWLIATMACVLPSTLAVGDELPWSVEDLTGRDHLPPKFCQQSTEYCLVLIDDLKLANNDIAASRGDIKAKNLIFFADSITVSGPTSIELSGSPLGQTLVDRTAGSLFVLCRSFEIERDNSFKVTARGGFYWNGPPPAGVKPGEDGGPGGSFVLAPDKLIVSTENIALFAEDMADAFDFALQSAKGQPFNPQNLRKALNVGYPKPQADTLYDQVKNKTTIDDDVLRIQSYANHAAMISVLLKNTRDTFQRYFGGYDGQGGMASDFGKPHGKSGTFQVRSALVDGLGVIPQGNVAASKWLLATVERLQSEIADAVRVNDTGREFALYDYYSRLPSFSIIPGDRTQFSQIVDALNKQRSKLAIALNPDELTVSDHSGLPHKIDTIKVLSSGRTYIGPTGIALNPIRIAGRSYAGLASRDPATNLEKLSFSASLIFDPWITDAAADEIRGQGGTFGGSFDGWSLQLSVPPRPGLSNTTFSPRGNEFDVTLAVDPRNENGYATLLQLLTTGLLLDIKWTASMDPRITGVFPARPITFTRQTVYNARVSEGALQNGEEFPLLAEYGKGASGFQGIVPAIEVKPHGSASVSSDPTFSIPPEAMSFQEVSMQSFTRLFYFIDADHMVDEVRVTNDLDPVTTSGDKLLYVTAHLISGVSQPASSKDYQLPARPEAGYAVYMPAFRLPGDQRKVRIEGVATYQSGAQRKFTIESDGLAVAITNDVLTAAQPQ